jgi:hypothetical protein
MESLIPWILALGGGVFAVLVWLWFSAERDLKNRRQESERAQTERRRLDEEITKLNQAVSERDVQLEAAAKEQDDVVAQQSRLQQDIAELRRRLELSQAKVAELGEKKEALAGLAGRVIVPDERVALDDRIAALEQELAAEQSALREMDHMRERLAEGERIRQALREENRRHQEQLSHWRQRMAESEANARRLTVIQEQFGELLTMQAALAESQRKFQDALVGFTRLLDTPAKAAIQTVTFEEFIKAGELRPFPGEDPEAPSMISNAMAHGREFLSTEDPNEASLCSVSGASPAPPATTDRWCNWRPKLSPFMPKPSLRQFGVLRMVIVCSTVGIIGVVYLISKLSSSATAPRLIRVAPPAVVSSSAATESGKSTEARLE